MKYLITIGLLLTIGQSFGQIKGRIYVDENQNNKFDKSEKTIEKAIISDGYQVIKSNNIGEYTLKPNENGRFIFLKVPSGYKTLGNHYIKIDSNQQVYDFPVIVDAKQKEDVLDFIQITDTETALYGTWIDNIKNYSKNQDIPLIMHTGDICYEDGMKFHAKHLNSSLLGTSINYAVGNHDLVKGKYGEELFEQLFGPTYYSFEKGPVHFVVTPMWGGDYAPSYTKDQVIKWLKQDLAEKDPSKALVMINHDFSIGKDFILKGKNEVIDLKKYNLKAWLYGHWHNNYSFVEPNSNVHVISTNAPDKGGIDHSVGQFLHISINKQGVQNVTPIYTNLDEYVELADPIINGNKVDFNVNIYDSGRKIKQVNMLAYDKKGNQVINAAFESKGYWTWTKDFPLKVANNIEEILIEVVFQNGSSTLKKRKVNLTKKSNLETIWSSNISGGIWKTSPLIFEGLIYTGSLDDTGSGMAKIVALNSKDGSIVWSIPVKNSIKQKLYAYNNLILATDVEGTVYALDSKTGKQVWTKTLRELSLPNYVTGSVLKDGIYYAGTGNFLTALNAETGEVIWKNKVEYAGEAMPGEISVTEDQLITGTNWNALFVHDRKTGNLLWKKNDDGVRFRSSGATILDDKIYITGLDGLFVLNKTDGKVINKMKHNFDFKVMGAPLITSDSFITGTAFNGVASFDKETLMEKWRFDTRDALIFTSSYSNPNSGKHVATVESKVIPLGENLIFGASDGYLYIIDQNGKLISEKKIAAPILADPVLSNGNIYVADFAGNIHCIKL